MAAVERIYHAVAAVFAEVGADPSYGRQLPAALASAGLQDVAAEVHTRMVTGGTDNWTRGTVEQLAGRLLDTGVTSAADIELFLSTTAQPSTRYAPH